MTCDISHIVHGDGWYKDENGYHYTKPDGKSDNPEEPIPEDLDEVTDGPEVVTEVVSDYLPPNTDYLPPDNDLRDYLPPKFEDAKRKRQVKARKVYRRFVKKQ